MNKKAISPASAGSHDCKGVEECESFPASADVASPKANLARKASGQARLSSRGAPLFAVLGFFIALDSCTTTGHMDSNRLVSINSPRLVSIFVDKSPTIDGNADDGAWRAAIPLELSASRVIEPNIGVSTHVQISSVYTDTSLFFLVRWDDPTEDASHKSWIWNKKSKAYEEGQDREDMFAIAFEFIGTFTGDMLSGEEGIWDVWHWKAARTNPQGYAMDKTHVYSKTKPERKANSYKAKNGLDIWIERPEDKGDSVEKKQKPPETHQGDKIPQYVAGTPSASAADVKAKAKRANGKWTLEMERALNTENPDDVTFDPRLSYRMAIAPFDKTGHMDKASGIILLSFGKVNYENDFEKYQFGEVQTGFSPNVTGKGSEPLWTIIEDQKASSGKKVLAQVSADKTSYRFPICIDETDIVKDVDISVRFKPLAGDVDRSGGIIWRYKDKDNYYVVRANAIEGNVVLYKFEKGKRSHIPQFGEGMAYGKNVDIPTGEWSTLRVIVIGNLFQVYLNGEKLFSVVDDTFKEAGKIGLWTKADSQTYFDDLRVVIIGPVKR